VKPYFQAEKAAKAGKVLIATVEGDLHDIGKNLVVVLAEASGFEVHDLGVDVPPETFAENTRKLRPDFLGMSSLLSTTVPKFKETVDTLNKEGLRETVKVIIGGVSASQAIADEYRIDAYAADAVAGVRRISRWKTEQT
jgi:methylmalonyl-CoA mutase cobalamin-binding domain/chain